MELADILGEESVIVCAERLTKAQVLQQLAEHAAKVTGQNVTQIHNAIRDREELGSTGLGNGIAIPHGKVPNLPGVTAVFMKLAIPIDFESIDDQPVDLAMLLLAPVGAGADHLKALARVARLLRTDSVTDELRRTNEPSYLYSILTRPVATHKAA